MAPSLMAPSIPKSSLSNSNPQLNSQGEGQGGQGQAWDGDKTKMPSDSPGNRSSMAEPRVGSMNIPGLSSSNKKVQYTSFLTRVALIGSLNPSLS